MKSNTFFWGGWVGHPVLQDWEPQVMNLPRVSQFTGKPVPRLLSGENIASFLFHSSAGKRLLHSKGGKEKGGKFYFGDRFCYVNESRSTKYTASYKKNVLLLYIVVTI